jgi:hypothetical protein
MKKVLSLVLVLVLAFGMVTSSFASSRLDSLESVDKDFNIIEQVKDKEGEVIKEISEYNGVVYYFEKSDEYIITIDMDLNNDMHVNKKNNIEKDNTFYSTVLKPNKKIVGDKSMQLDNKITLIKETRDGVVNEKIFLKAKKYETNNSIVENQKSSTVAEKIGEALEDKYGSEYSNRLIGGRTEQGIYAKLYESKSFYMNKSFNYFAASGTAVGLVALFWGMPQNTIAWICYCYTTGTGVLAVFNDVTGNKYTANVNYNKRVKINSTYPYRAGKTIYSYALVADKAAHLDYRKVRKNFDFDDNILLLSTGIENYLD